MPLAIKGPPIKVSEYLTDISLMEDEADRVVVLTDVYVDGKQHMRS